jgi:integrase
MVLLSLNTGLRRGELFGLSWGRVDLDGSFITVHWSTAKNSKSRHVPLNEEALFVLKEWREQTQGKDLVFPGKGGDRLTDIKRSWTTALRNAQIVNFRWHDMRHHFASRLVMADVSLNVVRELLGHADIAMTLRYAHLSPGHKAEAVARLVEDFRGLHASSGRRAHATP